MKSGSAVISFQEFIERKTQLGKGNGFAPSFLPDEMFDFQKYLVDWAVRQERAAIFADCGLGKTLMQLVWGENILRHTNKPVLLVTPLAVAQQTAAESAKFGIEAVVDREGKAQKCITITNYERLHLFDRHDFAGVICDESSAIKSFKGKHRAIVTDFLRKMPYRSLWTATPSPNDFTELGTASEALGEMGLQDMLGKFFKNDLNNAATGRAFGSQINWRFRGHAERPFWRWVSVWARAMRRPSDYGFDDSRFELPALTEQEHVVTPATLREGFLFEMPAKGLAENRDEDRRTIRERCEKAAALATHKDFTVVWCNLNAESDVLAELLPDLVEIKGGGGEKELRRREDMFTAFSKGEIRGLITKAKIGAWGMNWQHCNHTVLFPSFSYEQYYQLLRRFWRFGQKRPVTADFVTTEGGFNVLESIREKAAKTDRMFESLVQHMNQAMQVEKQQATKTIEVPKWLS